MEVFALGTLLTLVGVREGEPAPQLSLKVYLIPQTEGPG